LKHHLAGTQRNVGACKDVANKVKKEMWEIVVGFQQNLKKKLRINMKEETTKVSEERKNSEASNINPINICKRE